MICPCYLVPDELCRGFVAQSRWTYRTLRFAQYQKYFSVCEVTITETILMRLLHRLPHRVRIRKFKEWEESLIGADWDWLLIGRTKLFRMRIQAKRLYSAKEGYKALTGTKQVNDLIKSAGKGKHPKFAAYCFYNYWTGLPILGGPYCGSSYPSEALRGCTLAAAYKVLNSKNDLNSIAKISIPWICLVCCAWHTILKDGDNHTENWLPLGARKICINLAGNENEVPQCEEYNPGEIKGLLRGDNELGLDDNVIGMAAIFQDDQPLELIDE